MLETELILSLCYKGRPCLLSDFSETVPRIIRVTRLPLKKDYEDSLQRCIEDVCPRSTCMGFSLSEGEVLREVGMKRRQQVK